MRIDILVAFSINNNRYVDNFAQKPLSVMKEENKTQVYIEKQSYMIGINQHQSIGFEIAKMSIVIISLIIIKTNIMSIHS